LRLGKLTQGKAQVVRRFSGQWVEKIRLILGEIGAPQQRRPAVAQL
jgi:hypothetical protein